MYTLPEDHQWHGGGIYETGFLQEWHYWTGFFTDIDTHEQFGIFYNLFYNANGPGKFAVSVFFSLLSLDHDDIVLDGPAHYLPPHRDSTPRFDLAQRLPVRGQ